MFMLLLLHNEGNLEMAEFDGHSDDEIIEKAVVAAA
jgi:hypothetical protein